MFECFETLPLLGLYSLAYVRLRLVSLAIGSLNAVSYTKYWGCQVKGMSKVALFTRMNFVNSSSSDTRSSDIINQHNIIAYDTACIIFIIASLIHNCRFLQDSTFTYSYQLPTCNQSDK